MSRSDQRSEQAGNPLTPLILIAVTDVQTARQFGCEFKKRLAARGQKNRLLEKPPPEKKTPPSRRSLDPGFWIQGPGSRILDLGSWIQGPGFRVLAPGSWIQGLGSRVLDPRSWIQKILDPENPGFRALDPGGSFFPSGSFYFPEAVFGRRFV